MKTKSKSKNPLQNSKLIILLKTFDKKSLKVLQSFLDSPYFNENQYISQLFKYLIRFAPNYQSLFLSKENIFKHLFENKTYKDIKVRQLMSELFKLVEKFIAHEQIRTNDTESKLLTLEFYAENGYKKYFNSIYNELQKKQDNIQQKESDFYWIDYKLTDLSNKLSTHPTTINQSPKNYHVVANKLHIFYLTKVLIEINSAFVIPLNFNIKIEFSFFDALMEHLQKNDYSHIPLINLFYHTILLSINSPKTDYETVKQLFLDYAHEIAFEEKKNLSLGLINYCIKRINEGREEYYPKVFDLYQIGIKEGVIYSSNKKQYIEAAFFKNIVTLGLRLKHFDLTQDFIEDHQDRIITDHPKDVYSYNLANLYLYKKNYPKAIKLLGDTAHFDDISHQLDAKKILLKIYYETQETEALDSLMNAFRVFIHRNSLISEHRRVINQNFINTLYKIVSILPGERKKIIKLKEQIKDTKGLAERLWLNEKIDELR